MVYFLSAKNKNKKKEERGKKKSTMNLHINDRLRNLVKCLGLCHTISKLKTGIKEREGGKIKTRISRLKCFKKLMPVLMATELWIRNLTVENTAWKTSIFFLAFHDTILKPIYDCFISEQTSFNDNIHGSRKESLTKEEEEKKPHV